MRAFLLILLSMLVALAVVACGTSDEPEAEEPEMSEDMSSDEGSTEEHEEEEDEHEGMDMSSDTSMAGEPIAVVLTDVGEFYSMSPESHSAHAGPVTFVANNEGLIEHELIVVKLLDMGVDLTDLHVVDGQIPEVDEGGTVYLADVDGEHYGQIIAATGHGLHLEAGHTIELNADLVEGQYLLLCNIETHYQLGMWSEFEAS